LTLTLMKFEYRRKVANIAMLTGFLLRLPLTQVLILVLFASTERGLSFEIAKGHTRKS